jgi:transposase
VSRFPSADHLAAWAGLVPGQNESAGKRRSGKMRKGNQVLRTGLVQAAHAVSQTKNNYLVAQYHRIAARRGKKKALVAVAHSLLVIAYYILLRKEAYSDLGANNFDEQDPVKTAQRLVKRIEKLGYHVTMQAQPAPAAA